MFFYCIYYSNTDILGASRESKNILINDVCEFHAV